MQVHSCTCLLLLGLFFHKSSETSAGFFGSGASTVYNDTFTNFTIYWNVPTFMCHKFGMYFRQVSKKYGIVQNDRDKFRGNKIAILYDPGDFPALLKDNKDNIVQRNGGVPQEGNLTLHLDYFRHHLEEQIPNSNFSGLGIIDFESWKPIFRQNWDSQLIYRDFSLRLERQKHPFWPPQVVLKEATERFEKSGRIFMKKTIELAKQLRPNASWGFYAYPYCFNWTPPNAQSNVCDPKAIAENNEMSWLFGNTKLLLPSVYLHQKLNSNERVSLVRSRVQEAIRVSKRFKNKQDTKVFAYHWYKYRDERDNFVEKRDIINTFSEIEKEGADGIIIWGSSKDLDSKSKCEDLENYLHQILGPAILRSQYQLIF